ncbi:MAG: GH39 family glycosyl hydrolase [Oceanipulchritudo sp.]
MKVDFENLAPPLSHTWRRCFGQGRAAELLREDFIAQLATAKEALGFEYLRFHGLFHDEMTVVTRRKDGSLCFQWRMIDQIFDTLLRLGIRPFVELNPMPVALASGDQTIFHFRMNVTPPSDFSEWGQQVEAFTRHCVQRYGLPEVRQWYFEVWNEPNLAGFWSGTQEEYWELYRQSALAVKRVDPALRIGGPATAQAMWIPELINYCVQNDVPLDFVSTHSYQQDELTFYPKRESSPHAPADYLLDQFKRIKSEVAQSTRPDLEIHWTEWNSLSANAKGEISWTDNPTTDALYCGSFLLRHCTRADELCDSMSWWIISDIFGEDGISPLPFSHTYGLFTSSGLPKPSFHAFKWLARMTGERLALDPMSENPACGSLVTREAGIIRALFWYHPPVESAEGDWTDSLELDLPHDCVLTRAHLSAGQGSAYETWQAMGCPPNLTPSQEEALAHAAQPLQSLDRVSAGTSRIEFSLQPYEVLFLEWARAEAPAERRGILRENAPPTLEASLAGKTR